jgi:hypothetical protein
MGKMTYHLSSICLKLILEYMYSGFIIVNLYFCGKQCYQAEYCSYVKFILSSVSQILLISKVT